MIVKVKEPLPAEYGLLRKGQILFTYLHLAASRPLTEALLETGVTGVALWETIQVEQQTAVARADERNCRAHVGGDGCVLFSEAQWGKRGVARRRSRRVAGESGGHWWRDLRRQRSPDGAGIESRCHNPAKWTGGTGCASSDLTMPDRGARFIRNEANLTDLMPRTAHSDRRRAGRREREALKADHARRCSGRCRPPVTFCGYRDRPGWLR